MGRWAQAHRRGGGQGPLPAIGPPPQPILYGDDGFLMQAAQCSGNEDGTLTLWYCETETGEYSIDTTGVSWETPYSWGEEISLTPGWYKGSQTGNGTAYIGESVLSEPYQILA